MAPNEIIPADFTHRIPPDLKREISYTTLKVLSGGRNEIPLTKKFSEKKMLDKVLVQQVLNETQELSCERSYTRLLQKPLLQKHLVHVEKGFEKPVLDTSLPIVS